MIARGKKPTVVIAAIARELAGFIWAIGQEMRSATKPTEVATLISG
jgi:transposase